MKDRFNGIDVLVVVANFQQYLGMRVDNIYDLSPRTYLLKLKQSGRDKQMILIESGMRVHSTKYSRETPKIPSIFSLKLRKHINNKQITSIKQLGFDRVIDFTFGSGESAYHLIVELHSKGNIILTDYKYTIMTLLRTFLYKNTDTLIATNHIYPTEDAQQIQKISIEKLKDSLETADKSLPLKQFLAKFYGIYLAKIFIKILRIF